MTKSNKSTPEQAACQSCGQTQCSAATRKPNETEKQFAERQKLESRLCRIRYKVIVLSGKGGVGKSTKAVNLAAALRMMGWRVGLLDVDIHGPSVPTMLGLENVHLRGTPEGLAPVNLEGLKVISMGFFLTDQDEAIIWRGPLKMGAIRQFLADVAWGELDYLIIDSPPGTGDKPLSVCQLIGKLDGAVVVTTPQRVAAVDVRKCISFCRALELPVIGVIENMSGFVCPRCGERTAILCSGGGYRMANEMKVPFLGSVPIDPQIAEACDQGHAFIEQFAASSTAAIMQEVIQKILERHQPEMLTTGPDDRKQTPEDREVGAESEAMQSTTEFR